MAELLEALQCNAKILLASARALPWTIEAALLAERRKDLRLPSELTAFDERVGKLRDSLGRAMRHTVLLAGEPVDRFLKVLAFYDKVGVLDGNASWQTIRLARNQAALAYTVDDTGTAAHFNDLHELLPALLGSRCGSWPSCRTRCVCAVSRFIAEFGAPGREL
jgi:hypothetical protein